MLAGRCAFSLAELKYEYPREITPDGHTPTSWLRELTEAGVRDRFPVSYTHLRGPAPTRCARKTSRPIASVVAAPSAS